jgi:methionine sulfoxide reductase heme-binding subunit
MNMYRILFWLVLALPGALMLHGFANDGSIAMDLLHPTGEFSLRLMVLAMLAGPLADFFGRNRFFRGWLSIRRNLGVAAFGYGALHLLFYVVDMGTMAAILDEISLPAIWTGWIALALMFGAASISTNAAMRVLGRRWKRIQQGAYIALFLALAHWVLLDREWGPALVHLAPLLIAWSLRGWNRLRRAKMSMKESRL